MNGRNRVRKYLACREFAHYQRESDIRAFLWLAGLGGFLLGVGVGIVAALVAR